MATVLVGAWSARPAAAAVRRTPTLAPTATVIDGPSSDIKSLTGMVVSRDGTGGVIYLKDVGGVPHVFVSSLIGGVFQPPKQVDAGLAGASSHPVLAGTSGGQLAAAFINGGVLYAAQEPNGFSPWQPPQGVAAGAVDPSISMSTMGKTYLAFTAPGAGGRDVRAAYASGGPFSLASSPLDANPADNAGAGTDRPQAVACGDGTGIVVWGENGHIYSRRLSRKSPSVAVYQADPGSVSGWSEASATDPVIDCGGDSSYAAVAFRETLVSGSVHQTRVVYSRLHSNGYDYVRGADGLTAPGQDADQPVAATTDSGSGFLTAEQTGSHNLFATTLGNRETPAGTFQVNSLPQSSPPDAVPSAAGTVSTFIVWQQNSGGSPEIRMRYAPDGVNLNSEQVISSPALGPTDATQGLVAGGDLSGDAALAWVQGSGGQTRIVAAQLFQAPGSFSPSAKFGYSTTPYPALSWRPATELWGPTRYVVRFDGAIIGQTTGTSFRVPTVVSQGRHGWQVTAYNPAGVGTASSGATVFVDSIAPRASFIVTGTRRAGSVVHARVKASDIPRGTPRSDASWLASIQYKWGDRSKTVKVKPGVRSATHTYKRPGRYRVTVTVADKAGNRTVVTKKIRVLPKKVKPKKHRAKKKTTGHIRRIRR